MGPKVSDARYVAAVVNAGGMGFIVAAGFPEPSQFRDELRKCAELTGGKPFGVNFYVSRQLGGIDRVRRQLEVARDEGVFCAELAGASPEGVLPYLREAGMIVVHKVPAVRYAKAAARCGVDAITIVGNDCGGHPGIYGIGSMVQAAHAASELDIPFVVGGGIGTGSQLAAVLAMGADAVVMGTRMLVAEELPVHRDWKQRVVAGDGSESIVVKTALKDHHRVFCNSSAEAVALLDAQNESDFERYRPHVMGALSQRAYETGDWKTGLLDYGPAAIFADRVESVEAIFDRVVDEAREAVARIESCRSP